MRLKKTDQNRFNPLVSVFFRLIRVPFAVNRNIHAFFSNDTIMVQQRGGYGAKQPENFC